VPSRALIGTPRRLASRSCSAMSMAALALYWNASLRSTSLMIAAISSSLLPVTTGASSSSAVRTPSPWVVMAGMAWA